MISAVRSSIVLLLLVFAALGLLLSLAATYDSERQTNSSDQARLFDECIAKAEKDGELIEDEYFACAYNIYS
jgi:hypothetical protein